MRLIESYRKALSLTHAQIENELKAAYVNGNLIITVLIQISAKIIKPQLRYDIY